MADYVDVPGDCIHFPGYPESAKQCLLCNPKPTASIRPPDTLRMGGASAPSSPVWVHKNCTRSQGTVIEAQYSTICDNCGERIHEGDEIAPDR